MSGTILLGAVAARLALPAVACNRCDRHGRLNTARLLTQRGPDLPMPMLHKLVAADCPRMMANVMHDPCGVHCPNLSRL